MFILVFPLNKNLIYKSLFLFNIYIFIKKSIFLYKFTIILWREYLLKKNLSLIFQIAAVFIGTIVGAGLASGQEISQFFTTYGYKSFLGIFICGFIYIAISSMIIYIS